jgi:hypothetical protein
LLALLFEFAIDVKQAQPVTAFLRFSPAGFDFH